MKKVVSILLIISSLFTLSSSIANCAAPETPEISKVESSSDTKSVDEKDIAKEDQKKRDEKIKQFLVEKGKYFPDNKISEIKSILHNLSDVELEIVLNSKFKHPSILVLLSFFLGEFGIDRFIVGDIGMGILKIIITKCFSVLSDSVLNIPAIKEFRTFSTKVGEAIQYGKESELIDEVYNNTLSESDRANFKKYMLPDEVYNSNWLSESDKAKFKKSDLLSKAIDLLVSSLSKSDLVKIGSLVITCCIGCVTALYDIFTSCGRAKQANYNHLLNVIGKK